MTSKISSELEDKLAKMDDLVEDIKATMADPFANARGNVRITHSDFSRPYTI